MNHQQGLGLFPNKAILYCHKCHHPLWVKRDLSGICRLFCPKCKREGDFVKVLKEAELE